MAESRTEIPGYSAGQIPYAPRTSGLSFPKYTPPPASTPLSYTKAASINKVASNPQIVQATFGGTNTLLPIVYGQQRVGGRIFALIVLGQYLYVGVAWCHGEVDSIVSATINDAAMPSGVTRTDYTGTSTQGVDSDLATAFAWWSKTYADTLHGICYSSFKIKTGVTTGFPRFAAVIKGKKVSSTSGGAKAYSQNPAYIIADFIENTTYGMGRTVDWATVATVAAACSATVGGEAKRLLNLVIDQSFPGEEWLQTLRDYAGCFVVPEGSSYRLVADAVGSSVYSFTASNIVADSLRLTKRGTSEQPTMVEVIYTDASVTPYREARYQTTAVAPRRVSRISKPGITRHSEAVRYAIERLNAGNLCDLSATFDTFDAALSLQVGDIIDVTHPIGLTAKEMRVVRIDPVEPGRWRINAVEYDPAVYDSSVATAPTTPDTTLPSPSDATKVVTGLTVADETANNLSGVFTSRMRVTWTDPADFPYVDAYRVEITKVSGGAVVQSTITKGTPFVSTTLDPSIAYYVAVSIITTSGVQCNATTSASFSFSALPSVPANVTGFAANVATAGTVALTWNAVAGIGQGGYEIRYDGANWGASTYLDRVAAPTTRYESTKMTAGSHTWRIKALDAVRTSTYPDGQQSASEATVTATVVAIDTSNIGNGANYITPSGTYYTIPFSATDLYAYGFNTDSIGRYGFAGTYFLTQTGGTTLSFGASGAQKTLAMMGFSNTGNLTISGTVTGQKLVLDDSANNNTDTIYAKGGSNGMNIKLGDGSATRGYIRSSPGAAGVEVVNAAYTNTNFIVGDGGACTYRTSMAIMSDAELKDNIRGLSGSLAKIVASRAAAYERKDRRGVEETGFVAQEISAQMPDAIGSVREVFRDENGNVVKDSTSLTVNPVVILAHAVEAIKELAARVSAIEKRL
jgi:hypothetical protein